MHRGAFWGHPRGAGSLRDSDFPKYLPLPKILSPDPRGSVHLHQLHRVPPSPRMWVQRQEGRGLPYWKDGAGRGGKSLEELPQREDPFCRQGPDLENARPQGHACVCVCVFHCFPLKTPNSSCFPVLLRVTFKFSHMFSPLGVISPEGRTDTTPKDHPTDPIRLPRAPQPLLPQTGTP